MDVMSFPRMSYVLEQTKQQQVLALGQLRWTVGRVAAAVKADRATVTRYLRTAGLQVRGRGRPSEEEGKCRNFRRRCLATPGQIPQFLQRGAKDEIDLAVST